MEERNRCKDCVRFDTSMARQVTPPRTPPPRDPPLRKSLSCPPEDATIVCRRQKPPRLMPPEDPPVHKLHIPESTGYRCLCTVPKDVLVDPNSWCRCCKKESNVDAPCGEEVTRSIKLVYELPGLKFDDRSITQQDYCAQPLHIREIPPWHPCKTEFWSRPDVPSVSESTYQRDFLPPPTNREEKRSVLLMPMDPPRAPPCTATPCYKDFCQDQPDMWNVYRKAEERENLQECENGDQSSRGQKCRLIVPSEYPRHGLSLCESECHGRPADWWKISACQPKDPPVNGPPSGEPDPKTIFRDKTTYDDDFKEFPPVQRKPSDYHPLEKFRGAPAKSDSIFTQEFKDREKSEVPITTHRAHFKPPKPIKPAPTSTFQPEPFDHSAADRNPCYWAHQNPAEPDCWTSRCWQDSSGHPENSLTARNYKTSLIDLKTEARNRNNPEQLSMTSEGNRPWIGRSVYA